ncbi:hypothetical protein [Nocardia rhizosphaerae]|uniref:Secreted protein n=1 Tax=Nocardia rhizosphaerae TaxID=1691571 RepID=A0ABV8L908_9NOCA
MRYTFRLTAATVAGLGLLTIAPAAADPVPTATDYDAGSSVVDSGSAAMRSAIYLAQQGDLIGFLVLLGVTPFQLLTSGICDLATFSALRSPCVPGPQHYYTEAN